MKHNKQMLHALCLLLAALLCACGAAGTSSLPQAATSVAGQQEEQAHAGGQEAEQQALLQEQQHEAERIAAFETGALRVIDYRDYTAPTPDGIVVGTNEWDEAASEASGEIEHKWVLWMIDPATRQQTRLCEVDMDGLVLRAEREEPPRLFYAGGEVYAVDRAGVCRIDLETGAWERVYRMAQNEDGEDHFSVWFRDVWFTDGTYFYAGLHNTRRADDYDEMREPKQLIRVSLATGEVDELYEIQSELEEIQSCYGEEILFKTQVLPRHTQDFFNKDSTWYDEAGWQENFAGGVSQVRGVNVRTGEMRVLYDGGVGSAAYIANYGLANAPPLFHIEHPDSDNKRGAYRLSLFDFNAGDWYSVFEADTYDCSPYFYDATHGRMLIGESEPDSTVAYHEGTTYTGVKYWAVDVENGAQPAPWRLLKQYLKEYEAEYSPAIPLAAWGEYYLVQTGEDAFYLREWEGGLRVFENPASLALYDNEKMGREARFTTRQYSLILQEDYWNSQANYLPVTVTEGQQ